MNRIIKLILPVSILLIAASLVACGGSSGQGAGNSGASYAAGTVNGTITGLQPGQEGLLVNNGTDFIIFSANGSFSFDKQLSAGDSYNVTVYGSPVGTYCAASNGSGAIAQNDNGVGGITVDCESATIALPYFFVTVAVAGLSANNSVTFALNGGDLLTVNANGLAVFSQALSTDQGGPQGVGLYDVTVATNPSGQTCTLTNASGTNIGSNFVDIVQVTAVCN